MDGIIQMNSHKKVYILLRGQGKLDVSMGKMVGAFSYIGLYESVDELQTAYKSAEQQIEEDFAETLTWMDSRSLFAKKENFDRLMIHCYDTESREWDYEVPAKELFLE